jgi:hypothetical protein
MPVVSKSSIDSSQILFTYPASGMMEVYILHTDTMDLAAGPYSYTVYVIDSLGRKFNATTAKLKLADTVQDYS